MIAIVRIGVSGSDQSGPECALAAFGNDDVLGFSEIGGKAADKRELEAPASRARLPLADTV